MLTIGQPINVQASKFLGTPAVEGIVVAVDSSYPDFGVVYTFTESGSPYDQSTLGYCTESGVCVIDQPHSQGVYSLAP